MRPVARDNVFLILEPISARHGTDTGKWKIHFL